METRDRPMAPSDPRSTVKYVALNYFSQFFFKSATRLLDGMSLEGNELCCGADDGQANYSRGTNSENRNWTTTGR